MKFLDHIPQSNCSTAVAIAKEVYGLESVNCQSLESERDQNFLVNVPSGSSFVLKIANGLEEKSFLEGQNAMLDHLAGQLDFTPQIKKSRNGLGIESFTLNSNRHWVRMVRFLPGQPMSETGFISDQLAKNLGQRIAQLSIALESFDHPTLHREFHWDLAYALQQIESRITIIRDPGLRNCISQILSNFKQYTAPLLDQLPKSIIHNDANDGNVILVKAADRFETEVAGLVDFGDVVHSWTISDLAVACAYAMLKSSHPLKCLRAMVQGYHCKKSMSEAEVGSLYGLICLRLCLSAAIAAEQTVACPENDYLNVSQSAIRHTLPDLAAVSFPFANAFIRQAIDWPVVEHRDEVVDWLVGNQKNFAFPVNPTVSGARPAPDQTKVLDLGVASPLLPENVLDYSESELTRRVFSSLRKAEALVGVGQYLEPRILYSSEHFTGENLSDENRTIHLGIDLFADSGTTVVAPMPGWVHYSGLIDKPLDYGGLLILRHATDSGVPFYTLYGHLEPTSFQSLEVGQAISQGQPIATLGAPSVNGGWPPHLHFQCMLDLLDLGHEFPGVAAASEVQAWAELSPDPNLILGIASHLFPPRSPQKQKTLERRRKSLGKNLSIAYRNPLKIVRGWKQYLFDETGRRYLDAYNNVPHVGHAHPQVVDAVHQQMRLLNTNTRYLHDKLQELAERITATLPDPLQVCYFVNSASEANELALRMARQHTGEKNLIVLDAAYHGHSTTLIDISPYKHNGPGGQGSPSWVSTVPLPDTFRGPFRDPATAGARYAETVSQALAQIGGPLCGFICESCPSVGGQFLLPEGYLQDVYQQVRSAGGVCIADDVQTGYGRLGSHMYGFELQDVTPDMVILGKPMGNGHPLAAVITTRAIADSFDNGMEFFSTFGGNPVSCAAGIAVLDVLEEERLQENAWRVGTHLLQGLERLKSQFELIGDVRGRGYFIGIELVSDNQSRYPATNEAYFVSNICRENGILIGTDGPDHNVLKIRPPMCFNLSNADELLSQLESALFLLGNP